MREIHAAIMVVLLGHAHVWAQSFSEPQYIAVQGTWYAASADGSVVVGKGPKVWTPALGARPLSTLPGGVIYGEAKDVSWDGSFIVGNLYTTASYLSGLQPVIWSGPGRSVMPLGMGPLPSAVSGVSGAGNVIVGSLQSETAIVWTGMSSPTLLEPMAGASSEATACSYDGTLVVGRTFPRATAWDRETSISKVYNAFAQSRFTDCSSDGLVAVGWTIPVPTSPFRAARMTPEGGLVQLPFLPGREHMKANGVSADGRIVVGYHRTALPPFAGDQAFIWDAHHGTRNLSAVASEQLGVPLHFLGAANGISPDGRTIVGYNFILRLRAPCAADVDDGTGSGGRDGAVTGDDLSAFLRWFEAGSRLVDLDDGTGRGVPDAMVDVSDLLYFLGGFATGC